MKRIDRSSKGHYESETASRTATLGVHNLFEPYSNKLLVISIRVRFVTLYVSRKVAYLRRKAPAASRRVTPRLV